MDSRKLIGYVLVASFNAAKYHQRLDVPTYNLWTLVGYISDILPNGNDVQIYELVKKAHDTKQGQRSLSKYYVDLRGIW